MKALVMAFFVGTPDGVGGHDDLAHRLANNGRHWAQNYVCLKKKP